MRNDRNIALKLRLQGKSYTDITRLIGVPKSTLSGWLHSVILPEKLKTNINVEGQRRATDHLVKRNKAQTHTAIQRAKINQAQGKQEITPLSKQDILILGIALYWAEGHKKLKVREGRELTNHKISLTNSDPKLIKAFLLFLETWCLIPKEKVKIGLRIFPHHNETEIKQYWHKATGIPLHNFYKTYRGISKSSEGKRPFNRLPYGIAQITVGNTPLFHKILGYIEGIKELV